MTCLAIKIWKNLLKIKFQSLLATRLYIVKGNRLATSFLLINLYSLTKSLWKTSFEYKTQNTVPQSLFLKFTKRKHCQEQNCNQQNIKKNSLTLRKLRLPPQSNFIFEKQMQNII